MATEMRDYYQYGKKVGEFKVKHRLYLCYKPRKGENSRHETCENIKQMKEFFRKERE